MLSLLEDRALLSAVPLIVTNLADHGPGSLRAAIEVSTTGDTIQFDPSLLEGTIALESPLVVDHGLTIIGPTKPGGDPGIKIDGGNATRIFYVRAEDATDNVVMMNLELNNGLVVPGQPLHAGGPASYTDHLGGAAINFVTTAKANLTLDNMFLVNNNVDGKLSGGVATGGAIDYRSPEGTLTITGSRFVANMALGGAGAFAAAGSGADGGSGGAGAGGAVYAIAEKATIDRNMFVNNTAVGGGGGWGGTAPTAGTGTAIASVSGGRGGDGGSATGGALDLNGLALGVGLNQNVFHYNRAISGASGNGGDGVAGANGGAGGNSGAACGGALAFGNQVGTITMSVADLQNNYCIGAQGGIAGLGGAGGNDGLGGCGGVAYGGAIFSLGNHGFVMNQLRFRGNSVRGGNGATGDLGGGVGGSAGGAGIYVQCVCTEKDAKNVISDCTFAYGSAYCGAGGTCTGPGVDGVAGKGRGAGIMNDAADPFDMLNVEFVANYTTDGDTDVCGPCHPIP